MSHSRKIIGRRRVLSMAVAIGAGAALASGSSPARAAVKSKSLAAMTATNVELITVGNEPSALVQRYTNVFKSIPDPDAVFYRTAAGALKLAAACHGLTAQVQVFDVSRGTLDVEATPFRDRGAGAGGVTYEPRSSSILAFGSTVKRITASGAVSDVFTPASGTTSVAFARAVDSKNRVWSGNYPTGSATRYDPSNGSTVHTPRVHSGAQYVYALTVDNNDNVYAGTGTESPRIVTWHTDSPTILREIPLPSGAVKGFVYNIEAHSGWLFVSFAGASGTDSFRVYDIAAGSWKSLSWTWSPASRYSTSLGATGDIYAVWNTVGTHKLMRINSKTLIAEFVCLVPGNPRGMNVESINGLIYVNLLCTEGNEYKYIRVSAVQKIVDQAKTIAFVESPLRVQGLLPSLSGTSMYIGAYMGDGIGEIDLVSSATWRSASNTGIAQIEGMFQYDDATIYVGSYGSGRIFKFNPKTKAVTSLINLSEKFLQSRPFAWTQAAGRVVAGTVAEYGHNTGALVSINPTSDSDISVTSGPIAGQSVLGLVGEGDVVYGSTGVKGGYGSINDTKPAHVFAWNVRLQKTIWKQAVTGEVEINSPILIRGDLYVSTSNGVIRFDKANGVIVSTYKILDREADAGYKTSVIGFMPEIKSIFHQSGGTVNVLDIDSGTKKEILRGNYSDMVLATTGKLYLTENGTNVVQVSTVQQPTIRSTADLVTVGAGGWLYVARSLGGGKFAPPFRADSGFNTYVRSCHVVDWNGDGILDVVTNHNDGTLQLHKGLARGGFAGGIVIGATGWLERKLAIGMWGTSLSVVSSENKTGVLQLWPILPTCVLGKPTVIGSGWARKQMVMLAPSRSLIAGLIVNEGGSLVRYVRGSAGIVSATPIRLSTGGFTDTIAMTGVINHKTGLNGIVGVDALGATKYVDIASSTIGASVNYSFLMKGYRFASS